MLEIVDITLLSKRIDAAVKQSLENDVAPIIKDEMSAQLGRFTFPRSRGAGGLSDPENFNAVAEQAGQDEFILTLTDDAPFQSYTSGGITLAEVVEEGAAEFRMPGPRPFMANTEENIDIGRVEQALNSGIDNTL